MRTLGLFTLLTLAAAVACSGAPLPEDGSSLEGEVTASTGSALTTVTSAIPAARLAEIKATLPVVGWPRLQAAFADATTFWYDHETMQPSYQETGTPGGGANANVDWFRLVAPQNEGRQVFDVDAKRWRFPFATTAGTDDATNVKTVDFLSLPKDAQGNLVPIPISVKTPRSSTVTWEWQYPNGTLVGEIIVIQDGTSWIPTEVRTRERFAGGWATNLFRPFVEASALSATLKAKRPNWAQTPALAAIVQRLDGNAPMTPKSLNAVGLTGTFDQAGFVDDLPDFGDPALVRDLLTTTQFVSAYGSTWRQGSDGSRAFAPTTTATFSIVPNNYTAGLIEVRETSCLRCHKESGRFLSEWYQPLYLYGEVWGKDNIFTFHPFDESRYRFLDDATNGTPVDNRRMNNLLVQNGMIETYSAAKHTGPFYTRTAP